MSYNQLTRYGLSLSRSAPELLQPTQELSAMTSNLTRRRFIPSFALPFAAVACGAAEQNAAPAAQATTAPALPTSAPAVPTTAVAPTTAPAPPTPAAAQPPAAPLTFQISQGASKATFRVREQL